MSWHRCMPLIAAMLFISCASQWVKEQEELEARAAAGPSVMGDPSSCPKLNLGTIVLDPCCTPDNQCGGDGTKLGYGCSSLADPMFRSFVSNPPDPRACAAAGAAGGGAVPAGAMQLPGAGGAAGMPPMAASAPAGAANPGKCPSVMAFGMSIGPCCTPQNHCGADGSAMGFGCTDLADAMFRMIAGAGVPPAQTCDGAPL